MCTDFLDLRLASNILSALSLSLSLSLSALLLIFVSKPIVNSKIYRQLSLVFISRSERKSSPVMIRGERKLGMSANSEDPSTASNDVASKLRTELCRQV